MGALNRLRSRSQGQTELSLTRMLVGLVGATLLPVVALAFVLAVNIASGAKTVEEKRIASVADALKNATDQMLAAQLRTAWAVAADQALQTGELERFYRTARRAAETAGGHFILVDGSGQQLVNTSVPLGQILPRTANPAAAEAVLQSGEAAVGNIGVGAVVKEPLYAVRVPVQIGTDIRYVLSYVPPRSVTRRILEQLYLPDGWFAAVMDGNGTIVARSHRHEEFVGQPIDDHHHAVLRILPDYFETSDKEGRRVAVSARGSGHSAWSVVVGVPLNTLQEPMRAVVTKFSALGALALVLSLLGAYFSARMLQVPTKALAKAARHMGVGADPDIPNFLLREANQIAVAMRSAQAQIREREQALQRSEAHLSLAMREMSHRALNLLSVVQALAKQTAATSAHMDEFKQRFAARLAGLAQSHRLLIEADWTTVDLAELARRQLATFDRIDQRRVAISGAPFEVNATSAQILGMAFHELATNAIKHGALSSNDGQVEISWHVCPSSPHALLELTWEERSKTIAGDNEASGFGSFLLKTGVAMQLDGICEMDWADGKLVWRLRVPVDHVQPTYAESAPSHDDGSVTSRS